MAKKTTVEIEMYRQGDVILIRAPEGMRSGAEVPREDGRVVLAHGEMTGHSHAIAAKSAQLFEVADAANDTEQLRPRLLRLVKPVLLRHEEHRRIKLPIGDWLVRIQREYSPGELRSVAD